MASKEPQIDTIAKLLELGRLAEEAPLMMDEFLSDLPDASRQALLAIASESILTNLHALQSALDALEGKPYLLSLPAILSEDPEAAESAQEIAMHALRTRERLHRLIVCATRLSKHTWESIDLDRTDHRLHTLIAFMGALDVARSMEPILIGNTVNHWWWSDLSTESFMQIVVDDLPSEQDDQNQIHAYIKNHLVRKGSKEHQIVFRPDREMARALGASKRGLMLLELLGDRLDLKAAEPTTEEIVAYLKSIKG